MVSATPRVVSSARNRAMTAAPAVLRAGSSGRRPASPSIAVMVTPEPSPGAATTTSPGSSRAKPSTSNPQATLETEPGAYAAIIGV